MGREWIRTLITYFVLILVIISLPIFNSEYRNEGEKKEELKPNLTYLVELYPEVKSYEKNQDLSYKALSERDSILGNFIMSSDFMVSNSGYGGDLNILIGFDGSNKVRDVVLAEHYESRAYVRRVEEVQLYDKWRGVELKDIPDMDVDVVSGATLTSSAIITGVKESVAGYLSVLASRDVSIWNVIRIVLFAVVVLLSIVMSFGEKMTRFRILYLIFVVVVSGFILQNMLSVSLFNGWIQRGISISSSWMSIILLLLALFMPLLGKNRYYCTYLCPMGAVQELIGKISPFKKLSLRILNFKYFSVNDLFLLFILVAMYGSFEIDFGNLEPFISFAVTIASWGMVLFGVSVLLLSLLFNRPWCAVCPTGCVLNRLSLPKK